MTLQSPLIAVAILTAVSQVDRPTISAPQFRQWFEVAWQGRLAIPQKVASKATSFRYVFVAGLGHENMPGYFTQNAGELQAMGVPTTSIHTIQPSSGRSIEENLEDVRARFLEVAGKGPEKLVVIGHSRGACDALAFALRDPGFVRKRVQAIFLIQGPFGGSGLADYVLGNGKSTDRLGAGHRALARLIAGHERSMVENGKHAGMADLTRENSREFWREMLHDHSKAVPVVGPRVYYIVSATDPGRLRLFQRTTGRYLDAHFGPNDGMVALEDQSIAGLGTNLGVIDAGHADLTRRFPATAEGRHARQALMQSIAMAVGQPEKAAAKPPASAPVRTSVIVRRTTLPRPVAAPPR